MGASKSTLCQNKKPTIGCSIFTNCSSENDRSHDHSYVINGFNNKDISYTLSTQSYFPADRFTYPPGLGSTEDSLWTREMEVVKKNYGSELDIDSFTTTKTLYAIRDDSFYDAYSNKRTPSSSSYDSYKHNVNDDPDVNTRNSEGQNDNDTLGCNSNSFYNSGSCIINDDMLNTSPDYASYLRYKRLKDHRNHLRAIVQEKIMTAAGWPSNDRIGHDIRRGIHDLHGLTAVHPDDLPLKSDIFRFCEAFISGPYKELLHNRTGIILEENISPTMRVIPFLDQLRKSSRRLLNRTVILKLNGDPGLEFGLNDGLGHLPVDNANHTFYDIMARQIYEERSKEQGIRFLMMNSFATRLQACKILSKYGIGGEENELVQNMAPKVDKDTLRPIDRTLKDHKDIEYYPPGDGDLYYTLLGTGILDALLASGCEYAFISSSTNLGAVVNEQILNYLVETKAPMVVEVTERKESNRHQAQILQSVDGRYIYRSNHFVHPEEKNYFEDLSKHRYTCTDNFWINLKHLKKRLKDYGNTMTLPTIRKICPLDINDPNSKQVYQLETKAVSLISQMPDAKIVCVPETRNLNITSLEDIFLLRSDVYSWSTSGPRKVEPYIEKPKIILDKSTYRIIDDLDNLIRHGIPSLKHCISLKIDGPIQFAHGVEIVGNVRIINESYKTKTLSGLLENTTVNVS